MRPSLPRTLPAAFFEVAAKIPDRVALRGLEETGLSYGALAERVRRWKAGLQALGVRRGDRVAVCFDGGVERVIAVLATGAAGAAFVPIDPRHLGHRARSICEATGVVHALCAPQYRRFFGDAAISVERFNDAGEGPAVDLDPRDLAYIIHTSGTSGVPKGVAVEHGAVVALAQAQAQAFDLRPTDTVLQFASPSFDAFVSEVFTTLLGAATLRVATATELEPGDRLQNTLGDGVDMVTLPPSLWAIMEPSVAPALRVAISAGEPCPNAVVQRWAPGRSFVDAYGPTEATVCATAGARAVDDPGPHVGQAIAGVDIYVLDRRGRPVLPGMKGEVYIGGHGVSRGYWRLPARTAERFLPDPFSKVPGARMYRTGDLARWQSGRLVVAGRADRQLQVLGHRVEPEEVEAALNGLADVRTAAVVGAHVGTPRAHLVAHVVPAVPVSAEGLLQQLELSLPPFLRPRRIVLRDTLPRTSAGKIDLSALELEPTPSPTAVPPRSQIEAALAEIWCEMLGLPSVGVTDDFFAVGGQSVQAVRLIARIEEVFGRSVPMSELVEERTIEHLAAVLHATEGRRRSHADMVRLQPEGDGPPIVFCHALGGRALVYLALARALGAARPVWGLESPLVHAGAPPGPAESLPALAEALATRLDAKQARPDAIVGWSFGAVLALEVVRALERRRRGPKLLVMLDPGPASPREAGEDDLVEMVAGFALRAQIPMDTEALAGLPREAQLRAMQSALEARVPPATARALGAELRASAAHIDARRQFTLHGRLETPVLLVATRPPPQVAAPPALTVPEEWEGVTAGPLSSHVLLAEHGALLEPPHVSQVAQLILHNLENL